MNSIRDVPIIPPPDLRNIVDKTASFVARNGPEFESRIQQNEQNNPKFNFLRPGDPYNAYYQFKVRGIREGSVTQQPTGTTNGEVNNKSSSDAEAAQPTTNQIQSKLIKSFAEKVQIHEPPPDFEFMIEPPSVLALDLDIIKLTAQFVAIHGRSFLTNLMNKEQRNYQFDFLRPQHGLFSYFTQLIEQYTKIINQANEILVDLRKELEPDLVWKKVKYRFEWTKIKDAEKQKEQEEVEKERQEYAQIDWHDFVVVETVDYQFNEQGMFPPPTTPEQVGSRILMQQRLEEEENKQAAVGHEMDVEDSEQQEIDAENEANEKQNAEDKANMPPPTSTNLLPTNLNNVVIRKDYDPRQSKAPTSANAAKGDGWVISPITNERIPAEKLAEHMRYGLLDPRWVEQREKAIQEKLQQEEVFAPGVAIESSLKQMAERRTDIFGVGIDETEIGKKIGGEEARDKSKDKVTWDGSLSTASATTRAARANISIEEQIQQIHKMKGLVEEDGRDKIGPAMVPSTSSNTQSSSNNNHHNIINTNATIQMPPSNQMIMNKQQMNKMHPQLNQQINQQLNQQINQQINQQQQRFVMPPQPPPQMPQMSAHHMNAAAQFAPPPMNPMMQHLYPPHLHHHPQAMHHPNLLPPQANQPPLPPNLQHAFHMHAQPPAPPIDTPTIEHIQEPPTKKQRTEDSLIPEEEFLASHSGSLTLNISVPNLADKPELNMNGQTMTVTLNLTDMVSVIKSKINEQIGLAPGKQKLQYEGIFIKDSNTLAYYNMIEGSVIQLALKERGGKKK